MTTKPKHWDFLLHSTTMYVIDDILKSKALLPRNNNSTYLTVKSALPYVYTTYIFDTMKYKPILNNEPTWHGWYYGDSDFIFVIDTAILKDLPFIAGDSMNYGSCKNNKKHLLIESKGSLSKKPNMNKLKNHINNFISNYYDFYEEIYKTNKKEYITNSPVTNEISHEVLFNSIPIKYIKAILIPEYAKNQWYKKYSNKLAKYNVPILFFDNKPGFDYIKFLSNIV